MAKLYDISTWSEQSWYNTGGTRNKKIYLNPEDSQIYYFKESFNQGARDYKYEFWSEILASEIGRALGFPTLQYDIGKRGNVFGCISKSMINLEEEELVEGVKYLSSFDPNFILKDEKPGKKYTFKLINDSLVKLGLERYLANILDVIVFDALIGNSDRHQENWALITRMGYIGKNIQEIERSWLQGIFSKPKKIGERLFKKMIEKDGKLRPELTQAKMLFNKPSEFAPIYDSGCCFGRELSDDRIHELTLNNEMLRRYVLKGESEIHYEGEKLSHFELLKKLMQSNEHEGRIKKRIQLTTTRFKVEQVSEIVYNVDRSITDTGVYEGLPRLRKEFIVKLLTLRVEELRKLVDAIQ